MDLDRIPKTILISIEFYEVLIIYQFVTYINFSKMYKFCQICFEKSGFNLVYIILKLTLIILKKMQYPQAGNIASEQNLAHFAANNAIPQPNQPILEQGQNPQNFEPHNPLPNQGRNNMINEKLKNLENKIQHLDSIIQKNIIIESKILTLYQLLRINIDKSRHDALQELSKVLVVFNLLVIGLFHIIFGLLRFQVSLTFIKSSVFLMIYVSVFCFVLRIYLFNKYYSQRNKNSVNQKNGKKQNSQSEVLQVEQLSNSSQNLDPGINQQNQHLHN